MGNQESEKERFKIMTQFNNICKANKLQIAFNSTRGFKSHNARIFLNFWLYEPQCEYDKAPQRAKKQGGAWGLALCLLQ